MWDVAYHYTLLYIWSVIRDICIPHSVGSHPDSFSGSEDLQTPWVFDTSSCWKGFTVSRTFSSFYCISFTISLFFKLTLYTLEMYHTVFTPEGTCLILRLICDELAHGGMSCPHPLTSQTLHFIFIASFPYHRFTTCLQHRTWENEHYRPWLHSLGTC